MGMHAEADDLPPRPEKASLRPVEDRSARTLVPPGGRRKAPSRPHKLAVAVTAAAAATAMSIATPRPAGATDGKHTIPFRAVGGGRGPIDLQTGAFTTSGSFVATHLGRGNVSVNAKPGEAFEGVFRGADGDEVHVRDDPSNPGGPLPTNCPSNIGVASGPYAGGEFIVGGTGKFQRATGYITYSGCFAYLPDATSPTGFTFQYTFVDHGTLVK